MLAARRPRGAAYKVRPRNVAPTTRAVSGPGGQTVTTCNLMAQCWRAHTAIKGNFERNARARDVIAKHDGRPSVLLVGWKTTCPKTRPLHAQLKRCRPNHGLVYKSVSKQPRASCVNVSYPPAFIYRSRRARCVCIVSKLNSCDFIFSLGFRA